MIPPGLRRRLDGQAEVGAELVLQRLLHRVVAVGGRRRREQERRQDPAPEEVGRERHRHVGVPGHARAATAAATVAPRLTPKRTILRDSAGKRAWIVIPPSTTKFWPVMKLAAVYPAGTAPSRTAFNVSVTLTSEPE